MDEMCNPDRKLHWTQRIALVRHSLHVSTRTRNFNFFKFLQALSYVTGADHIASLSALLGDDADAIISQLDKFNAVIACVHEDAFKAVYDSVKQTARDPSTPLADRRAIYFVDVARQKQHATAAVDKMLNMAVAVVQAQPAGEAQDAAAEVFVAGTAFAADAIEVCWAELDRMEQFLDDFIRLEDTWSAVQSSTAWAVSAMKGVFNLMADPNAGGESPTQPKHMHSQSVDSYARGMLRRMSSALSTNSTGSSFQSAASSSRKVSLASAPSRRGSTVSVASVISPKRASFASPSSTTELNKFCMNSGNTHTLSPIPPTPADALTNPFEQACVNEAVYNSSNNAAASMLLGRGQRQRRRADSMSVAPHERVSPSLPTRFSDESPGGKQRPSHLDESPGSKRPALPHATPSIASIASAQSADSAIVYADDPLLGAEAEQKRDRNRQQRNSSILGMISDVLYAAPSPVEH